MHLSDEQIQDLFSFTQKKGVHWYDLQLEIVDHLACRIEEEMEADGLLNFEAALAKVYKGFGIFGLSKIVQEKQAHLQRAARKMWWTEVKVFFTWPKITLLLLFAFALWQLSLNFDPTLLMDVFSVIYLLISVVFLVYVIRTSRGQRKLLLLQFSSSHFSLLVFFYEGVALFRNNPFNQIEFCIYATLGILFKMASFQLYNKVKAKAVQLYPEAFA